MILTYNDNWVYSNDTFIDYEEYNPLGLPPYTIRLLYADGVRPSFRRGTGVQVSQSPNIWDLTYENISWTQLLDGHNSSGRGELLEVLGANSTGVKYMYQIFNNCSSLTSVDLFDTSQLGSMNSMFSGCSSLTSVPLFNTSNVTDTQGMFRKCSSLTTIPLFDTSNVTDMTGMFSNCTSLTNVPLFDTSNVTHMSNMFRNCSSLTTIPQFDTSKVTFMVEMFQGCSSLTTIPQFNLSKCASLNSTFKDCISLVNVPPLDMTGVQNMQYTFEGCTSLITLTLLNVSDMVTLNRAFNGCTSLTNLTLTNLKCPQISNMCSGCVSLTEVPTFNPTEFKYVQGAFAECRSVSGGALALYRQASSQWNPPTHDNTFINCGINTTTGMAELRQIPSDWGGLAT